MRRLRYGITSKYALLWLTDLAYPLPSLALQIEDLLGMGCKAWHGVKQVWQAMQVTPTRLQIEDLYGVAILALQIFYLPNPVGVAFGMACKYPIGVFVRHVSISIDLLVRNNFIHRYIYVR